MEARSVLAAITLAAGTLASQSAAARCTDTFNLGSMGLPSITSIGNGFEGAQSFDDCHSVTWSHSAEALGLTLERDSSTTNGIDLDEVSPSGPSLSGTVVDGSPGWLSFSNLLAGTYQPIVSGDVTGKRKHAEGPMGYSALLATTLPGIAAPVPASATETYAMLALGLAIVGWSARRLKA